jgi:hypothetical protein
VLGLSVLLVALRLCDDPPVPRRPLTVLRDWVLLGGCFGLGWWSDPAEIGYYALPAALLLLFHIVRRGLRPGAAGAAGAVLAAALGALPWLWDNVGHGFPGLRSAPQPYPGFGHHLRLFATYVLPMMLGLKLRGTGAWLFCAPLAKGLYALAVAAGAAFLVACLLRRRAVVLVAAAVLAPALYSYLPATWYWQDGRYAVFLAPITSLVGAAAVQRAGAMLRLRNLPVLVRLPVQQLAGALLVVLLGAALTLGALGRLAPYEQPAPKAASWLTWQANRNAYLQPTIDTLESLRVTHVYAGYWVGVVLAFEAGGGLTVSDVTYPSPGARYRPYFESVASSEATAWLYPDPPDGTSLAGYGLPVGDLPPGCIGGLPSGSSCFALSKLERYLSETDDPYRVVEAGDFLAVLPRNPVLAAEALVSAGLKP